MTRRLVILVWKLGWTCKGRKLLPRIQFLTKKLASTLTAVQLAWQSLAQGSSGNRGGGRPALLYLIC